MTPSFHARSTAPGAFAPVDLMIGLQLVVFHVCPMLSGPALKTFCEGPIR